MRKKGTEGPTQFSAKVRVRLDVRFEVLYSVQSFEEASRRMQMSPGSQDFIDDANKRGGKVRIIRMESKLIQDDGGKK